MFEVLQVLSIVVVAIAMALALAHSLELPGKLRLSREQYLAMQAIYYPGFTFGGISEPLGLLLLALLLLLTPAWSEAFWLTAFAFLALLAMHAVYWLVTHPVNNFWLKDFKLGGAGAMFFSLAASKRAATDGSSAWTRPRDQWEFSHVIRAGLGLLSLTLLATAIAS